jgi:hypothetical protein
VENLACGRAVEEIAYFLLKLQRTVVAHSKPLIELDYELEPEAQRMNERYGRRDECR